MIKETSRMTSFQSLSYKWYIKYFDAFFVMLGVGYLLYSLALSLPENVFESYSSFIRIRYRYLLIPAVMGFIYLLLSDKWKRKGQFDAEKSHAIFFGLIRFWLAAGISTYGFAKILEQQFSGANEIILRDTLLGDITGNYLTWYYFGFSKSYMLIVGYLQVLSALLLLFRRTTLLGIFLLLPIMVNIVLIDLFYGIPPAPTANSIVFTAALIYLLLLHTPEIINFFLKNIYALPKTGNMLFRNILRIAVLVFAFMSIYLPQLKNKIVLTPDNASIIGKWEVEQSSINGKEIPPNAWQIDRDIWSSIYFIDARYCSIGSNPYYFDKTRQNFGRYNFDKSKHLLNIYFLKTKESFYGWIDFASDKNIFIKGLMGRDSIYLNLKKVKM